MGLCFSVSESLDVSDPTNGYMSKSAKLKIQTKNKFQWIKYYLKTKNEKFFFSNVTMIYEITWIFIIF